MKPSQLNEFLERLDEVARHAIEVPAYKVLAHQTGITHNYLKNVMARLIKIRRTGARVPRETLLRSLSNEREFAILMEMLQRRQLRQRMRAEVIEVESHDVSA